MSFSGYNVLIATNDIGVGDFILPYFSKYGYQSTILNRAAEIILTIMDVDYDLIVLDLDLADLSGAEIIPILKKLRPNVPIIILSNGENFKQGGEIVQNGVVCRLQKPLTAIDIESIVKVVEKSKSRFPLNV